MKATVDGKTYVYIESELVHDGCGDSGRYKCRRCAADPFKQPPGDPLALHEELSNLISPAGGLACPRGLWAEDTPEGLADAIAYLLGD